LVRWRIARTEESARKDIWADFAGQRPQNSTLADPATTPAMLAAMNHGRNAPVVTLGLLVVALAVPAQGAAATATKTKVSLNGKLVDGTSGGETLRGTAAVSTPRSWKRTSKDGAPTTKFRAKSGKCSAEIQVSGRAVASRTDPVARIRSVTRSPGAVIGQGRRRTGAWRIVHLKRGGSAYTQDLPRAYKQDPPDVYGLAALRLRKSRFVDVRVFAWFDGCTTSQIRRSPLATGLATLLRTAGVSARIVKR
jgi:hypothetical protein